MDIKKFLGEKMGEGLCKKVQGKQRCYRYCGLSFLYSDDSIELFDSKTGQNFWAYLDYENGKYTGRLRLQEDDSLIPEEDLPPLEDKIFRRSPRTSYRSKNRIVALDEEGHILASVDK